MKSRIASFIPQVLVVLIVSILLLAPSGQAIAGSNDGAKTSPPPKEFQIQGMFDPNHKYLMDGTNSIWNYSAGNVQIDASTFATEVVDSIGITFYLQKWTGSIWQDVGSGTTYSTTKQQTYDNYVRRTAEAGYYYRARTVHWVSKSGTYEQGVRVSDYLLVK